jgi:hypothetical protein
MHARTLVITAVLSAAFAGSAAHAADLTQDAAQDASHQIYASPGADGSVVLGNDDPGASGNLLDLHPPEQIGGNYASSPRTTSGEVRVETSPAEPAATPAAPASFQSSAVREDLKTREDALAVRVAQMFHRSNGLHRMPN